MNWDCNETEVAFEKNSNHGKLLVAAELLDWTLFLVANRIRDRFSDGQTE